MQGWNCSIITESRTKALRVSLGKFHEVGTHHAFSGPVDKCNCDKGIDEDGFHPLTCMTGDGPVWAHNSTMPVWSDCLRNLLTHHRKEPRQILSSSDDRPDITIFDFGSGSDVELGIALADPWATDVMPNSALIDGSATKH